MAYVLIKFVMKKPVRTLSGVSVISVMSSPARCPHGKCIVCPGGIDSPYLSPQSYTGKEPAAMRGFQHGFDPYAQVIHRIRQMREIGHAVDKVKLIVMGGTFLARDAAYREWFMRRCFDAMNGCSSNTLEDAQRINEGARIRCVGITFETRPDYSMEDHVDQMLRYGGTMVELGVQTIYDDVLERICRGHDVRTSIRANRVVRDSSMKVGFHLMPGLPGSDVDMDLQMFREIFTNEDYKPDYIKIYPTIVVRGSKLYEMWKSGKYTPLSTEEAAELVAKIKRMTPPWVRIQRVQRDVPATEIVAGVNKGNLRQIARRLLQEDGGKCRCIRCREVGLASLYGRSPKKVELKVERYDACGGVEYFISYEDSSEDILIGFLRLRIPNEPHRNELRGAALIRDLHVYGRMLPVGEIPSDDHWQHRGYGAMLVGKAEEISLDEGFKKIATMSGVGAREYYAKLGFSRDGPFMSKILG